MGTHFSPALRSRRSLTWRDVAAWLLCISFFLMIPMEFASLEWKQTAQGLWRVENGHAEGLVFALIWLLWAACNVGGGILFVVLGLITRFQYERGSGGALTGRDFVYYFSWLQLSTMMFMLIVESFHVNQGWFSLLIPYLPHGLMILCALWLFKGRLSELGFRRIRAEKAGFAFVAVVVAYGLTYFFLDPFVTNPVANWFHLDLGSWREESISAGIKQAAEVGFISVGGQILLIGVIGPIAEEMVFRGLIMGGISRRLGTGVAIVMSALLFALFHADITYLAPLFVLGLVLGGLYGVFRSLWVPILFHIINNTASVLFDLFR